MPVSHRAERAEGKKSGHRRRSPHAAGPRAIPSAPPVAALADEGALGVKACRRVPVAQLDSSSGFLIRRSQVRVLPGTPIKSIAYVLPLAACRSHVASNNYKQFQRLPLATGGSTQH